MLRLTNAMQFGMDLTANLWLLLRILNFWDHWTLTSRSFVLSLILLQDDEDGHVVVLLIIEDLMTKTQEAFLDHFARLGVFSKVQALMGGGGSGDGDQAESMIKSQGDEASRSMEGSVDGGSQDDAKEILPGRAYHWKDWSICRGRDCLYVWSDSAALELSNGSNGWFRFILDGKLATMYSSGSPENGNDSMGKHFFKKYFYIEEVVYVFQCHCIPLSVSFCELNVSFCKLLLESFN